MAGEWLKVSILMLCVNIMIYTGASAQGLVLIEGDILSKYTVSEFDQSNYLNDSSASGLNVSSEVQLPEQRTAQEGAELGSVLFLLDALNIVYDTVQTVFNIAFAPFVLFKTEGIPYFITLFLAPVLSLTFWLSIIQLLRGAS